jgi:hypothetical protein
LTISLSFSLIAAVPFAPLGAYSSAGNQVLGFGEHAAGRHLLLYRLAADFD